MFYSRRKQLQKASPTPIEEFRAAVSRIHALLKSTKASYEATRSESSKTPNPTTGARFIPMASAIEEEFIELIRRISELVVTGERYAANHWNSGVFEKISADSAKKNGDQDQQDKEKLQNHLAVFEYFCERNVLGLIVNIITGVAFSKPMDFNDADTVSTSSSKLSELSDMDENKKEEEDEILLLPPLSIATQGVQSVSILIQNVSRATSLYFLLSNQRINELIDFQLDQYLDAMRSSQKNQTSSSSAEMAELDTYFITFLKSLAMRMNAETLQFFLRYPDTDLEKKNDLVRNLEVEFPLYARTLQFCSPYQDSFVRITAMNICLNTIRLSTVITNPSDEENDEKEALDHLTTFQNEETKDDSDNNDESESPKENDIKESTPDNTGTDKENAERTSPTQSSSKLDKIKYSSPDGTLVNVDLPTRERLAIAHHVCTPSRVQAFASPIFIKLTHLCGDLIEALHDLNDLDIEIGEQDEKDNNTQRKKITSFIESIVADLQNELMFLDDLLEVGLTSLNEQTVEMMLATFIYPSILQPLKVHLQRHPYNGKDECFYHESKNIVPPASSIESETESNPNANEKGANDGGTTSKVIFPFPFKGLSKSLAQSGLLGDVVVVDSEENVEDEKDAASPQTFSKEHSDIIMDNSPPKAALIALITVLFTLKNRRVIYFVLTALFHPLAPNSSGGSILKQKPNVMKIENKEVCIQVDHSELDIGKLQDLLTSFMDGVGNNSPRNDFKENDKKQEECIFSLSPTLAKMLKHGDKSKVQTGSGLRKNPYREALLSCLNGNSGMLSLRKLAVFAVDAAMLAIDGERDAINTIFFGENGVKNIEASTGKEDQSSLDGKTDIFLSENDVSVYLNTKSIEFISSLCSSLTTASVCSTGLWKLEYNPFVAHSLSLMTGCCGAYIQKTINLLEFKKWQTSSYLVKLTSFLGSSSQNESDMSAKKDEEEMCAIMDKIFRDPCDESRKCVLDYFECDLENDGFRIEVSKSSCLGDCISFICSKPEKYDPSREENYDRWLHPVSLTTMAYLQLDSFHDNFNEDIQEMNENRSITTLSSFGSINVQKFCLPRSLCYGLFDESPKEALPSSKTPKPGTIVTLVGRSAFPCVCEVAAESANLFKDATSSVVADGVKWQSLYLVAIGRYMVLAEPEKSTGGNGIIVTSCLLSNLTVQKDVDPMNTSPARRLLISHASLSENPPGVFELDPKPDEGSLIQQPLNQFYPHSYLRNKRAKTKERNVQVSHMDLWFEDHNAAEAAYQTLVSRSYKARSRRGKIIKNALKLDELR